MRRGRRSGLVCSLAMTGAALLAAAPAAAVDIHVTTTADQFGTDTGACSLREAVQAANSNAPFGGCVGGLAGVTDRILLGPGTHALTIGGGAGGNEAGDLLIFERVELVGAGVGQTTIAAAPGARIATVTGGPTTIAALTLTGGRAPDGASLADPDGAHGGALRHVLGQLALRDCAVEDSRAGDGLSASLLTGAGSGGVGGSGGAIHSSAPLTVERCSFTGNRAGHGGNGTSETGGTFGGAGGSGGAIHTTGPLTVSDSTFAGNAAGAGGVGNMFLAGVAPRWGVGGRGGSGGAIARAGADALTLTDVEIAGDRAGDGGDGRLPEQLTDLDSGGDGGNGGGVFAGGGGATVLTRTSISGARAGDGGHSGVDDPVRGGSGGGLSTTGGTLTVMQSEISDNRAGDVLVTRSNVGSRAGDGGGIHSAGADLELVRSTVADNRAGIRPSDADHGVLSSHGGGVFVTGASPDVEVRASTLAGNVAEGSGGALAVVGTPGATVTIGDATVAANVATSGNVVAAYGPGAPLAVAVARSILAGGVGGCDVIAPGVLVDGGGNVNAGTDDCPGVEGDPDLRPLADNGGFGRTMLPGPRGAATDSMPLASTLCQEALAAIASDQRFVARGTGAGCEAGAVELRAPTPALAPASHDFGPRRIDLGAGPAASFTLSHVSPDGADLLFSQTPFAIAPHPDHVGPGADQFTAFDASDCVGGGDRLAAGESCAVSIRFDPFAQGPAAALLRVSTLSGTRTASLHGAGTFAALELEPAALDLGTRHVDAGPGEPLAITLSNGGTGAAAIGSATLHGDHPNDFEIVADDCAGIDLGGGETCQVKIAFAALGEGPRGAQLIVPNDLPGGPLTATVGGVGEPAAPDGGEPDDGGDGPGDGAPGDGGPGDGAPGDGSGPGSGGGGTGGTGGAGAAPGGDRPGASPPSGARRPRPSAVCVQIGGRVRSRRAMSLRCRIVGRANGGPRVLAIRPRSRATLLRRGRSHARGPLRALRIVRRPLRAGRYVLRVRARRGVVRLPARIVPAARRR